MEEEEEEAGYEALSKPRFPEDGCHKQMFGVCSAGCMVINMTF